MTGAVLSLDDNRSLLREHIWWRFADDEFGEDRIESRVIYVLDLCSVGSFEQLWGEGMRKPKPSVG